MKVPYPLGTQLPFFLLFKLGKITNNTRLIKIAHKSLKSFSKHVENSPTGFTNMLSSFLFDYKGSKELVVVLDKNKNDLKKIIEKIKEPYLPQLTIIVKDINDSFLVDKISPWISPYTMINDKPSYFICKDFTCMQPTTDLETALNYLYK